MADLKTLDARGLSCPQPAMLAEQFLKQVQQGMVEVLVDSGTSRDNVTRIAKKAGWQVTVEAKPGEGFRLVLQK